MSNHERGADAAVRCSPLVHEPFSADEAARRAGMFKALADPVRLQLFSVIASHAGGEACVCDLAPFVDVSQPTISHHLRVLRESGLVASERRGTWVHYRVEHAATGELLGALAGAGVAAGAAEVAS